MKMPDRTAVLWSLIPAVAVFLLAGFFSTMGIDLHHDGVMFRAAVAASEGKTVFREIFCQYGLLPPLLQGGILKIFGQELIVLKIATALFYSASVILCDRIWRRFLTTPFRLLNLALFVLLAPYTMVTFHIWSSVYALFFMLLATELLIRFLEKDRGGFLFWAGICAMIVPGLRWTCGAVTLLAIPAVLILAKITRKEAFSLGRSFGIFFAGTSLVALLFVLYISLAGAWNDCFTQCFRFASNFAGNRGGYSWSKIMQSLYPFYSSNGFLDCIFAVIPLTRVINLIKNSVRKLGSGKAPLLIVELSP